MPPRLADVALAATLLLLGRALLGSLAEYSATHDLDYFDDSEYQSGAAKAVRHAAEWAPLYRMWAQLLRVVTHDSLLTFHLNAYVLILAVPVLVYGLARVCEVKPLLSFAAALAWLLSAANLDVGPRVATFSLVPLLAWLAGARLVASAPWRWSWLCAGALFCSYIRPEFFYALLLMLPVGLWLMRASGSPRSWIVPLALPVLAIALLALAGELPIGGSRATMAIRQHVLLSVMAWQGIPAQEWQSSAHLLRAYPSLDGGLLSFMLHDPGVFLRHALTNAQVLFSGRAIEGLRPGAMFDGSAALVAQILIVLPFLLALRWLRPEWPPAGPRRDIALAWLLLAVPSLLLCFVIHPRPHYLQLPQLVLMLLVLIAAERKSSAFAPAFGFAGGALALLAIATATGAFVRIGEPTPVQATVLHLRSLDLPRGFRILDDSSVLHFHLPGVGASFQRHQVKVPLPEWLAANPVDVIVMGASRGVPDKGLHPSWSAFVADPGRDGYTCEAFAPGGRILCRRMKNARASSEAAVLAIGPRSNGAIH